MASGPLPVTRRNLPPADEVPFRRWVDRSRWKLGDRTWFSAAERAMEDGESRKAYRIADEGVRSAIEAQRIPVVPRAPEPTPVQPEATPVAEPQLPHPSVEPIELHPRDDPADHYKFARESGEQTTAAEATVAPTFARVEALAQSVWSVVEAVGIGVVVGAALAQAITFLEISSNEEKGWFLLLVAAVLGGIGIVLLRRDLRSAKEPT